MQIILWKPTFHFILNAGWFVVNDKNYFKTCLLNLWTISFASMSRNAWCQWIYPLSTAGKFICDIIYVSTHKYLYLKCATSLFTVIYVLLYLMFENLLLFFVSLFRNFIMNVQMYTCIEVEINFCLVTNDMILKLKLLTVRPSI